MADENTQPNGGLPEGTPPPVDPKMARVEADLAETRRMVESLRQNQQRPGPQAQPQAPDMDELNKRFYKEPVTTAAAIAAQAANEAIQRHGLNGQDTLISVAKDQARKKDPDLWDKYVDEIVTIVNSTVDPQYRQNVGVWEFARDKAFGAHYAEIREEGIKAQTNRAPNVRVGEGGPSQPNGHQPSAPKGAVDKLSPDEREMAKMLDITPEAYASGKEHIENQSRKGPSSWDKVVTFNSRERRRQLNAKRTAAAK